MAKAPKTTETEVIDVHEMRLSQYRFNIVGTTPLVPHAMSFKAMQSLILPAPPKTKAEKATTMKHEPYQEYLDATYQFRDEDEAPTRLWMPGMALHRAVSDVAVDMKGANKAQIGRLTIVKAPEPFLDSVPIKAAIVLIGPGAKLMAGGAGIADTAD